MLRWREGLFHELALSQEARQLAEASRPVLFSQATLWLAFDGALIKLELSPESLEGSYNHGRSVL